MAKADFANKDFEKMDPSDVDVVSLRKQVDKAVSKKGRAWKNLLESPPFGCLARTTQHRNKGCRRPSRT